MGAENGNQLSLGVERLAEVQNANSRIRVLFDRTLIGDEWKIDISYGDSGVYRTEQDVVDYGEGDFDLGLARLQAAARAAAPESFYAGNTSFVTALDEEVAARRARQG